MRPKRETLLLPPLTAVLVEFLTFTFKTRVLHHIVLVVVCVCVVCMVLRGNRLP